MAKYLYNDVELPALPDWDEATYPYAVIINIGSISCFLYVSTVTLIYDSSNSALIGTTSGNCIVYSCGVNDAAWVRQTGSDKEITTSSGIDVESTAWLEWSNHGILNTDGSVYLAASTPIPLEGMKVIEWDGDITGLGTGGIGSYWELYRIGDSLKDISSLGVVVCTQGSDSFVVSDAQLVTDDETGAATVTSNALTLAGGVIVGNLTTDTNGIPEGLYFAGASQDLIDAGGSGHISLFAYKPTPAVTLTYDHTALLQGYWVGKRLAAMRGKRKPVAYLYNGVRLPDINSVWTDKETYPYAYIGYYVSATHTITLVLSKTTMTAFSGDDGTTIGDDALGHKLYSYYTDKAWSPWELGWFLCNPFWASHELACEDGTICLEASEPVPVYE